MEQSKYLQKIGDIYHTDATYVKSKYFLLTHKPLRNIEIVTPYMTANERLIVREDEFLKAYLLNERDRHKFIVIKGDNGSGKSHFIRWLKEMYIKNVPMEEESIVFIARAQSTLRGTLEQIIRSEVLQNHELKEKLEVLIEANEHLGKENLKNNILHQFAIAVKEDTEEDVWQVKLRRSEKKRLYDFLISIETQELLMKEGGPIDRIYKKLASESTREVMTEVIPRFVPEDFYVSIEQLKEIRQSEASSRAVKLIERIVEPALDNLQELQDVKQKRGLYANYLNQFLEVVIQRCTQLRGTDLKEVLFALRRELKKQGKNLNLFIEDITAFTGIDKALVEALISEHSDLDFNKGLCRVATVVGITNDYYNSSFPDNLKDRVSYLVKMDQTALSTDDDIAEMAARYLNAIYLEEEEVDNWYKSGADGNQIPISSMYQEHMSWASYQIEEGQVLPLYPFNKQAITQLYRLHTVETPRKFLQYVLIPYTIRFIKDKSNFPPSINELSQKLGNIPQMEDFADEQKLERQVGSQKERYATLLRIWGDRTLRLVTKGEKRWVGGLEEKVFCFFGLNPLTEFASQKTIFNENGQLKAKGKKDQELVPSIKETTKEKNSKSQTPTDQSYTTAIDEKQQKFYKSREELEKWFHGRALVDGSYRDNLIDFIKDSIAWELEGVPVVVVDEILTKNRVEIEGQSIAPGVKYNLLRFHRSPQFRYALEALTAWRIFGKKSWEFEKASQYALVLFTWLESEKERIINFVRKPSEISEWHPADWAIAAEFYLKVITGYFTTDSQLSPRQLYKYLLEQLKENEIVVESDRSPAWTNLQKLLKQNQSYNHTEDGFLRFFNRTQGSVSHARGTDIFTLDAAEIIKVIHRLIDTDFAIEKLNLPEKKRSPMAWYRSINLLHLIEGRLKIAVEEETKRVQDKREQLKQILGDISSEMEIRVFLKKMKDTLDYFYKVRESFPSELQQDDKQITSIANDLATFIAQTYRLGQVTEAEKMIILSSNPVKKINKHLDTLEAFKQLLDGIETKYGNRNDIDNSDLDNNPEWTKAIGYLKQLKQKLQKLEG